MTEPGRVEHNKPGQTRNGSGRISRTGSKKRGVGCVVTEWIGTAQGRGSVETSGVGTWALARRRRDLGFGAGCGTAASSGHDDNFWAETTTAGQRRRRRQLGTATATTFGKEDAAVAGLSRNIEAE